MTETTINNAEVAKFGDMAAGWWDPEGVLKPLHRMNPVRVGYIRERAIAHFGRDGAARYPLQGLTIVDVGCGGGLLCEPLARLGAKVVGIDAAERSIKIAVLHAAQSGLDIDYRLTTSEALVAAGERFDIVLNMEVVEHVDNVPLYMKSCADLVRPSGLMVSATINRTARALVFGIVFTEYILGLLPRGTHTYRKFIRPEELGALLSRNGLRVTDQTGVVYRLRSKDFGTSSDLGINYMMLAEKPQN